MQKHVMNLVLVLLVVVGVSYFAFSEQLNALFGSKEQSLFTMDIRTLAGNKTRIPSGNRGYIVLYADMEGCRSCLNKLSDLTPLAAVYEEIAFYAILRGQDNREAFVSFLDTQNMPGEYLVDPAMNVAKSYGLSGEPALMFFNRHGQLLISLPYNLSYEGLDRMYHTLIEEL